MTNPIDESIDKECKIVERADKVIRLNEGEAFDGCPIAQSKVIHAMAEFDEACNRISSMGLIDFAVALRHGKDNIDGKIF